MAVIIQIHEKLKKLQALFSVHLLSVRNPVFTTFPPREDVLPVFNTTLTFRG